VEPVSSKTLEHQKKKSVFFLFLVVTDDGIVSCESQSSKDINDKMDLV
jgi:hypothetical protein